MWGLRGALAVAVAAAMLMAAAAPATIVTYNFQGPMLSTTLAGVTMQSTISGSFSYDTSVSPYETGSGWADYHALTSLSFSVGSYSSQTIAENLAASSNIGLFDGGTDSISINVDGAALTNGFTGVSIYFAGGNPLSSSTSLSDHQSFVGFSDIRKLLAVTPNGSFTAGLNQVTAAPAPEPASWAMMLGGFALVGAALRRQRQHHARRFG